MLRLASLRGLPSFLLPISLDATSSSPTKPFPNVSSRTGPVHVHHGARRHRSYLGLLLFRAGALPHRFRRPCFADNTAAYGATVKGYRSAPDIARLINKFYLRLARLSSTRVWIEYVNSSRDLADIHTRLDDPIMAARWRAFFSRTGATRLPFVIPPIFGWSG